MHFYIEKDFGNLRPEFYSKLEQKIISLINLEHKFDPKTLAKICTKFASSNQGSDEFWKLIVGQVS